MKVLLIDLSSIFWQNYHATADQEIGAAFELSIQKIHRYTDGYDHVGICLDAPPYARKEIYPEYKAQRDAPPQAALGQLQRVKDRLAVDGFPLFVSEGQEADDVIASMCDQITNAGAEHSQFPAIDILTGDKDLAVLVGPFVNIISTQTGDVMGVAEVEQKFGVSPNAISDLLSIMGDKSDNIPGVKGIGIKGAQVLLSQWGTLDELCGVIGAGDRDEKIKPAGTRVRLLEHYDDLLMSQRLVALERRLDINLDPLFADRVPQPLTDRPGLDDLDDEPVQETTGTPEQINSTPAESAPSEVLPPLVEAAKTESVEIVKAQPSVIAPVDWNRQLEPTTMGSAWKLAVGLHESRLYQKFQSPEAIMAVLLRGRTVGLPATTALDAFHVAEGKPTMDAQLIIGLCMDNSKCEYFRCIDNGAESRAATYITKRVGDPEQSYTYTIEMAEQAELLKLTSKGKKTNWHKREDAMLRKTAGAVLARIVYPDIVKGLYDPDEMRAVNE